MPLHLRRMIWALALLLGATSMSWLDWSAQAARAGRALLGRTSRTASSAGPTALATTITVNSTADGTLAVLAANATCDLREAVAAANTNAAVGQCLAGMMGGDTINLSVSGTITLTAGELVLGEEVTVTGPGAPALTISGNNASRVFFVNNGVTARLGGLTITGGNGVSASSNGLGGGILNRGNLTVTASHVTGNTADYGGGIVSYGTLTVERSAVTGNTATSDVTGGGIDNTGGTLTLLNSTVSGNRATGASGFNGGGIWSGSSGTATITGSTITDNEAAGSPSASGVFALNGMVTVRNTIIAANRSNTTTPDVSVGSGAFASQGYNLIGNPGNVPTFTATGDQVGTMAAPLNPLLGPLANNGGTTPTHRPLSGSPAIDRGNSFGLMVDQRGVPRPQDDPAIANATGGDGADIGAVEVIPVVSGTITLTVNPTTNPTGAATELVEAINSANANPDPTTINLVCGTYTLSARNNTFYGFTGLPVITTPVTIEGNGAVIERSTATGTPSFRLLAVAGNGDLDPATNTPLTPGNLTLRQVTLRNGLAQGGQGGGSADGGGGGGGGLGGAVYNRGTLTVTSSTLLANTAQGGNGGNGEVTAFVDGGGGGGGLGGNGGDGVFEGGGGGGGFGGRGGDSNDDEGGGGGGTITDGGDSSSDVGGSGGSANGGAGGDDGAGGAAGGFGGGAGGGGFGGNGGNGGIGGGGGGGGDEAGGGVGGFGGGGGGGGEGGNGNNGGFGGGGGGGGEDEGGGGDFGISGYGAGNGGGGGDDDSGGGGGGGLGAGGAIFNDGGTLLVQNSTLSGNFAFGGQGGTGANNGAPGGALGGGIFARNGTVTLGNVTLNNNTANPGGGALFLLADAQLIRAGDPTSLTYNVTNSILANSPANVSDAFVAANPLTPGTITPGTNNNNLVELNGSTAGADGNDLAGVTKTADPQLDALTTPNCGMSGCRTPVHPLTAMSPAFNMAGGNATTVDQCGTIRPQGTAPDIGAYELPTPTPTISKAFSPTSIAVNGTATVTLALGNTNAFALTNASFSDLLTGGLLAVGGAVGGTCTGTMPTTLPAGATNLSFSGITIPAAGSCTVTFAVTSSTPGPVSNQTSGVTSNQNTTAGSVSNVATLTVLAPPTVTKAFNPASITIGGTSTLTLTLTNPNPSLALTGAALTDTLPASVSTIAATAATTCGGTASQTATSVSLSGGTIAAGGSCTLTAQVTSATPGTYTNTIAPGDLTTVNGGANTAGASAPLMVNAATSTPSVTIVDPFGCTGPGDVLTVTVTITNPAVIAQPITFTSTLPAGLVGLPGTGTSTVGAAPTVTATGANFGPTVLAAGQTATVTYQVQVGDVVSGAQLCISTASTFSGADGPSVQACASINCPPVGPGLPFPSTSEVSDQKAGSVLVYNLYSSSAASPNSQNTRISITNTNPGAAIAVHLFFVDGQTCSIADAIICLTQNQTATALASDLDPGTTGYLIAVASDLTTGCPVNFNFLIGDAYVKLASGHQANLGAEAFAALAGGPVTCDGNALTATLNFDGVSYNRAPRTLAASSIPARNDGNDTLLVVNRFGGNLATGAATLFDLLGIFYDDAENGLSFTFSPGTCQFRSSLSSNFPRTTPRLDSFIPAGRTGWLRLYSASDLGLLGAILNYNATAGTAAGAFNQGRNLHKLTLTSSMVLTIPIFPPNCLN